MGNKNTSYRENKETNIIQINQDNIDLNNDSRRWITFDPLTKKTKYVFWITNDRKIGKKEILNDLPVYTYSNELIPAVLSIDKISMCVNKEQDKIYVMLSNTPNNVSTHLFSIDVTNLSITTIKNDLPGVNGIKQCIIDNLDYIWYLSGNNILSRVKIDGTDTSVITLTSADYYSFGLTTDLQAFALGGSDASPSSYFRKIGLSGSSLTLTGFFTDLGLPTYSKTVGTFVLDEYVYFLCNSPARNTQNIVKISKDSIFSPINMTVRDIRADYGITGNLVQFVTDGVSGYFFENNQSTRQYLWKVDLSDLTCQVLEIYSLVDKQFIYGSNIANAQKIVCDLSGNNCDPSGFLQSGKGATGGI